MAVNVSYKNKVAAAKKRKSSGPSKFKKDVTGVLIELKAPFEIGKDDTYEFVDKMTGESFERVTAWRATIKDADGKQWYWNWPAYIDEDGDNLFGENIIQEDYSEEDLEGGLIARFYQDPQTRRSSITVIKTTTTTTTTTTTRKTTNRRKVVAPPANEVPWSDMN